MSSTDPAQPHHLRVFLASPGDVAEERQLALQVLEQLPYDPFLRGQITIETVAWDKPGGGAPMLATMTPQAAIAEGLPKPSECDIVIVIFWSLMGTPLPSECVKPDGRPYRSGTEWEYINALQGHQKKVQPEILVYRRTEKPQLDESDPDLTKKVEQWKQVEAFFADFCNPDGSIRRGWNEYSTPANFRENLELHLRALISHIVPDLKRARAEEHPALPELQINTAGGSVVFGDANVPGGEFVGRDKKTTLTQNFYFSQSIPTDEICKLEHILDSLEVPDELIHALFRRTVPDSRALDELVGKRSLISCLNFLAKKKHQAPSQAPLLEFLERLRELIEKDLSQHNLDKFNNWIRDNATKLKIDIRSIEKLVQQDKPVAERATLRQECPVALVKIEPKNLVDENEFNLTAWCRYGGRDELLQEVPPQSVPRDQLAAEIVSIIERVAKRFWQEPQLRLEPILPISLLNWNLHRIKLPAGPFKKELGRLYSVIFRSWERTYDSKYVHVRPKWPEKWKTCPDNKLKSHQIRCILSNDVIGEALFEELDKKVWVFLALCPPPMARDQVEEIFGAALAAGLPFIFWPLA